MDQDPKLSSSEAWQLLALESDDVLNDNAIELSRITGLEFEQSQQAIDAVIGHYVDRTLPYPTGISQGLYSFIVHLTQPYRIPVMTLRMSETLSQLRGASCKGTLLDYGAGGGKDCIIFARAGYAVTYADFLTHTMTPFVRKRFEVRNLEVKMVDVRNLSDERFDCVACMDAIEHVYDVEYVLADLVSHLKPNGCLVLYPSFFNSWNGDHVEKNCAYQEFFVDLLRDIGMRVEVENDFWYQFAIRPFAAKESMPVERAELRRRLYGYSRQYAQKVALEAVKILPRRLLGARLLAHTEKERFERLEPAISRLIDSLSVWRLCNHRLLIEQLANSSGNGKVPPVSS